MVFERQFGVIFPNPKLPVLDYSTLDDNIDIGSYPYFKEKPGTILVLRSTEKDLLKRCEEDVKKLVSSLK